MAKKNYNVPRTQRMDVDPQCVLASSPVKIGVNSDTELDASMSFSNSKAWNCEEWDE